MSAPLEHIDEQRTVDRATACGYIVRKLQFIGVRGGMDRIFGRNGRTIAIEFKRAGKEPTLQQMKRAGEMRSAFGWEVVWTDNYAEACFFLGIDP